MPTNSGLDGQVGYVLESTVGTAATVNKFPEFLSEGFEFDPSYLEPEAIRVGQKFKRGSRVTQSRKQVTGSLELPFSTRIMGGLVKLCIGSSVTTPTLISGSAYEQVHQTGDLVGKSATFQVGRPEPTTGTVRAHTYNGCKVTGWEFTVEDGKDASLKLDIDGWDESTATALASASFVTAEEFPFTQFALFLGGSVSGSTKLTVTGGTAPTAVIKSVSIKGENALATERYGVGNAGTKKEQLENGIPTITGTLDAEFVRSEFYDLFKANTATVFRLIGTGSIISGSDANVVELLAPEVRFKKVTPKVEGPDLVMASVEFEVYQNSAGQNPFQWRIVSADSAAI